MPLSLTDLDHRAARRSFDRAAGSYDQHAVLQHEVRRRLLERLDYQDHTPTRVLDLGCGTGQGSAALRRRFPDAQIIALDWAPSMLGALPGGSGSVPFNVFFSNKLYANIGQHLLYYNVNI